MGGLVQHEAADLVKQSGIFRNGDELARPHGPAPRMAPASEGLSSDDGAGAKAHHRLEFQPELTPPDRTYQVLAEIAGSA